jgi:predicted DNA-binding protein
MSRKTRKVQVTLPEEEFERLESIARSQGRKLAAVVRESVIKYCLEPESRRIKQEALEELLAVPPTPVPESYQTWKQEYNELKTKARRKSKE